MFFAAIYTGAVLLSDVIRTDDPGLVKPPDWMFPVGIVIAAVLFVWALVDRWRNRFRLPPERMIIGWHLVPDVLLLPPRMTIAVGDHLTQQVSLNDREREQAWRLLKRIAGQQRMNRSMLGQEFADAKLLERLLRALQLTGWIDLHRGQEDWFYCLRSDAEENLRLADS